MPRRLIALLLPAALAGCGVVAGDRLNDAQQVIADMKLGGTELQVTGTIDPPGTRYHVGDTVGLMVQVNKPAYVAVLRVMPSGATTLLFPNRQQSDPRVSPGTPVRIPPPGLVAPLPQAGTVMFEFIAATRAGSWLFTRKSDKGDFAELGSTTRELAKDIQTAFRPGAGDRPAASHIEVSVSEK